MKGGQPVARCFPSRRARWSNPAARLAHPAQAGRDGWRRKGEKMREKRFFSETKPIGSLESTISPQKQSRTNPIQSRYVIENFPCPAEQTRFSELTQPLAEGVSCTAGPALPARPQQRITKTVKVWYTVSALNSAVVWCGCSGQILELIFPASGFSP